MRISPNITYRGVNKTDALESLIAEKIAKLEQVYDQISSCRISLEEAARSSRKRLALQSTARHHRA